MKNGSIAHQKITSPMLLQCENLYETKYLENTSFNYTYDSSYF